MNQKMLVSTCIRYNEYECYSVKLFKTSTFNNQRNLQVNANNAINNAINKCVYNINNACVNEFVVCGSS